MPWACAGLLPPSSWPQPGCSPRDWPNPTANRAELGELTLGLGEEGRPRTQGQWSQRHPGCASLLPLGTAPLPARWVLILVSISSSWLNPCSPGLTPGCGAGGSVPLPPWQHQAEQGGRAGWQSRVAELRAQQPWLGVPGLAACRRWQEPARAVLLSVCSALGTASNADQGRRPSGSQLLYSSEGRERGSCPWAFPTLERATMPALPSLKQHRV